MVIFTKGRVDMANIEDAALSEQASREREAFFDSQERIALMADVATELTESKMGVRDLALIREAILSVIDDGDPSFKTRPYWSFWNDNEDFANRQRLDFADAVQAYIVERVK